MDSLLWTVLGEGDGAARLSFHSLIQVRARDLEMGVGGRGRWPVLSHFEMLQLQMGRWRVL